MPALKPIDAMLSTALLVGLAALPALASPLERRENDVLLSIAKGDGNATSITQYGLMFEDINNSGDGGLYAELLQNRALQIVDVGNQTTALYAWSALNGSTLAAVNETVTAPVSAALPNSFHVDLTGGQASFENEGYWGIKVDADWTYNVSFWAKADVAGANVSISLVSKSSGALADAAFPSLTTEWAEYRTTIKPSQSAADVHNTFRVSVAGADGSAVYFALFSLFPPTYKGRENGMRIDIAETIAGMQPSVWRFPGGNNLEGQTPGTRWRWNATLGPLSERPGRMGDWTYQNTDGLGLMEYLWWLEDLGVQGIMGVYAGYSLSGIAVNEEDLDPYVQEALDQIDFVLGDAATNPHAARRAALGHPEPFSSVGWIEVGNEDFFAEESYIGYRWPAFQSAIAARWPDLPLIATTRPFTDLFPKESYSDRHVYQTPDWMHQNAGRYDNQLRPPHGPVIFEGEYAAISTNSSDLYAPVSEGVGRLEWSTMQSACSEASYAIGFERNADLVFASAYAPMLQNLNRAQWTPNLIVFDAEKVYPSVSYYVQKLFSTHRNEIVLPVDIANGSTPYALNFVAGVNYNQSLLFVKTSNYGDASIPLALEFGADWNVKNATVEVLASDTKTAWNAPNVEAPVVPKLASVDLYDGKLSYELPAYSVAVFSIAF